MENVFKNARRSVISREFFILKDRTRVISDLTAVIDYSDESNPSITDWCLEDMNGKLYDPNDLYFSNEIKKNLIPVMEMQSAEYSSKLGWDIRGPMRFLKFKMQPFNFFMDFEFDEFERKHGKRF